MERILKIVIDLLRGATYDYETKFTQADSQSHYLQIDFKDTEIDFSGVSMKVNFIRSDGVAVTTSKASVTSSNKVQIPTNALAKFGELGIEIILIKGDSILTVNKLIRVTVIKTLAGEGIDLEIGDSFLNEINQLTVNLSKVLTVEGDKQIERVRATGNEVVKQVESILGNNPEGGNAAAVGGLSRAGIETLIDNVVGKVEDGKFPLTSAEVGKVYEAVNGKKYKCIKAYSGSSLSTPNANFIEMSLNNHADRLDNLFSIDRYDGDWSTPFTLKIGKFIIESGICILSDDDINKKIYLLKYQNTFLGLPSTYFTAHSTMPTSFSIANPTEKQTFVKIEGTISTKQFLYLAIGFIR